ncbi:MAG TPA: hypothetical protein VJ847_13240 [Gemmatimonadales bacterium]|nr:hypothetical protein [Gemmatimonadales bacterium]
MSGPPPALLFIVGPPAVGKMATGEAIAARTGFRLFHNHHAIDLALEFFPFGTPPFHRIVGDIRRRVFEEVAASDLPGLIFTYVWAFDLPAEAKTVDGYAAPFRWRGGRVLFAELETSQAERLRRNVTPLRLARKPTKRDLEASRRNLLELDAQYRMNSRGEFDGRDDYLKLDNTTLTAAESAERIIGHFGLGR